MIAEPIGLLHAAVDELANPLTPVLALGAALSAAVGSTTDAMLVGGVVVVNALVGATQRVHTERSLLSLEESGEVAVRTRIGGAAASRSGRVARRGRRDRARGGRDRARRLPAARSRRARGRRVRHHGRVASGHEDDPAPTGAAVAERTSMLYDGSAIAAGRAVALVVAVGRDTEGGRAASAAAEPPPSGVERRLAALTRLTVPVTVVGGAIVTGLGFLYRRPARGRHRRGCRIDGRGRTRRPADARDDHAGRRSPASGLAECAGSQSARPRSTRPRRPNLFRQDGHAHPRRDRPRPGLRRRATRSSSTC